jgi:hypothetical protein
MRPTMSRLDTALANGWGASNRLHHRPGKLGIAAVHPTAAICCSWLRRACHRVPSQMSHA